LFDLPFGMAVAAGLPGEQLSAFVPTFGSQSGASVGFAGLLVEFAASHFFLNAAAFDQFSESSNCFLNRFPISHQ
jgi:hypothetical protein